MKHLFLFTLLVAGLVAQDPTMEDFKEYMKKYNKNYDNEEEEAKRFEIYKENIKDMKENPGNGY